MSSKSRKHSSPPARTPQGATSHGQKKEVSGELEYQVPSEHDFLTDELKTPKGRNPLVYAFLVLLLIFLTVIFILPNSAMRGWGAHEDLVAIEWTDPVEGLQQLSVSDVQSARLHYETVFETRGGLFAVAGLTLTGFLEDPTHLSDLDVLRLALLDRRSQEAGIHVSDAELAERLRTYVIPQYGGAANYTSRLRTMSHIGGVRGFEESLRRLIRIERYLQLEAVAATVPTLSDVETAWKNAHREYRFQWAKAVVANYADEARAEAPTDEGLEEWVNGLSTLRKSQFLTKQRFAAEVVGVAVGSEDRDVSALTERFPRPDDWDDDAKAREFYQAYYFKRYTREKPEESEESTEQDAPLYWTFDEVKDRAVRDARVFAALGEWRNDLEARSAAGVTIDLRAEAEQLGLDYQRSDEAITLDKWKEIGGLVSTDVANRIGSLTQPGQFSASFLVGTESFALPRLVIRVEPTMPPIAEIRDAVLDVWVEERQSELAEQALVAMRDELLPDDAADEASTDEESEDDAEPLTTADAFRAAAEARGLEVGVRDWLDRRATEQDDPQWSDEVNTLVRSNASLYSLADGDVSDVLRPIGAVDALYLVRADGDREVPFDRMTASQYQGEIKSSAQRAAGFDYLGKGPYSDETLKSVYKVRLVSEERRAELEEEDGSAPVDEGDQG